MTWRSQKPLGLPVHGGQRLMTLTYCQIRPYRRLYTMTAGRLSAETCIASVIYYEKSVFITRTEKMQTERQTESRRVISPLFVFLHVCSICSMCSLLPVQIITVTIIIITSLQIIVHANNCLKWLSGPNM